MLIIARKIKRTVNLFLLGSGSVCFIVLVSSVSYQVFTRYILNNPSTITEELARFGQIFLALLAATYAWGAKKHISITFLLSKLDTKSRKNMNIVLDLLVVSFIIIGLIIGGWNLLISNQAQSSPSLNIPMNIIYLIFPLCGFLMLTYSILNAIIGHEMSIADKEGKS